MKKLAVLFVCLGNICRSPTAEAVFRKAVVESGLSERVVIDSAGTDAYHVGQAPDSRAQRAALKRGYDLSGIRARKVVAQDFERFDLILAVDKPVLAALNRQCPAKFADCLELFMAYAQPSSTQEISDPYYGGPQGFEIVLDQIEAATEGLLALIKSRMLIQ
ncbi:low molecular weight protein-tyrosine-phosphatase [Propionivibrio dicarboxylicus]|uniref:protein-tyrosine-phosphatase n=1 Tax=Propionivibrio dicarboxylicus TaxID=83767 RepID=A0A1G8D772_9RHOO|nr:low molecular weight protein-tyrosine-phosphatase [Propionivibrio dicarboxylicus]SDH53607.1 protein-tyrosine phosphatase [Propionivibrio dicarboxylicus]